jgi:NodT family efflux transporter outer membrane factor (OMF) lipoprotein
MLASCTVGPDYKAPDLATPDRFQELPPMTDAAASRPLPDQADLSQWWRQFHDPELERLVAIALRSNLTLKSAASRIEAARRQEIIAGAAGLPGATATGAAAALHSNSNPLAALSGGGANGQNNGSGMGSGASSGGTDLHLYAAGFDATWEIDLFGGVRRGVEAARANSDAALWELRDAEVSLTGEVANDYLTLRAAQARIAIVQTELARQNETLGIVQARAQTGFVTDLDVNQQSAQVAATKAQLPPLQAQTRAMIHALGVLLGDGPDAYAGELETMGALPGVPATLPVGLPSDLLRRRPDVRDAERKLAAATAQVGVAVAQLYPKFDLLGAANFSSSAAGDLLSSRNFSALGAGIVMWPIFDAGKAHANIRIRENQMDQAYLAYRQAVLKALQDAEDALARYTSEQDRLASLQQSQTAADSSFTIARQQYVSGLVTYLNVLTAETQLLDINDEAEQSRQALAQDLVSLYKALGGGWSDAEIAAR